jgi:ubiquitin carboxyl-terminal hydrolase 1
MRSQDDIIRELYGQSEYEYHQDYRGEDPSYQKFWGITLSSTIFVLFLVYKAFFSWDYATLSPPDLLWNCLVYVTPSRLLDLVDNDMQSSTISSSTLTGFPRTHAAKSETMRRILGFDKTGGIMTTVAQAGRRRLSNLPGLRSMVTDESRPAGLGNWDNSCYQNSVLQGLASLRSFPGYLGDPILQSSDDKINRPDMDMVDSMRDLISTLKDPASNGKTVWTPTALKNMDSWNQQDAQEYFSKVLDEIDKEVDKAASAMREINGLRSNQGLAAATETNTSPRNEPSSILARNPLEGLIAQRVGCTACGYSEGLSLIPFNCLTVPLGQARSYDISQLLDEYTKLEWIEGVQCGKCTLLKVQRLLNILLERNSDGEDNDRSRNNIMLRLKAVNEALENDDYEDKTLTQKCQISPKSRQTTTKSKQWVVARPPKSLAVHFNRSVINPMTGAATKNTAGVTFPKFLDLAPWCLGSITSKNPAHDEEWLVDPAQSMISGSSRPSTTHGPIYELRAVVTHRGGHENGHYICYRKHPILLSSDDANSNELKETEKWWRLSDADVTIASEAEVRSQGGQGTAFMLFYDCIQLANPALQEKSAEALNITEEIARAASIPLPADDANDISESDNSSTTESELDYTPARAIVIPPRTGIHYQESMDGIESTVNMVMV